MSNWHPKFGMEDKQCLKPYSKIFLWDGHGELTIAVKVFFEKVITYCVKKKLFGSKTPRRGDEIIIYQNTESTKTKTGSFLRSYCSHY